MPLAVQILQAPSKTLYCPCCQGRPEHFLPIPTAYVEECRRRGVEHPLDAWETLNLESYLCPICGAADRDRLQVLALENLLSPSLGFEGRETEGGVGEGDRRTVLEIAPSPAVSQWFRNRPDVAYRSADLYMPGADDRVDITNMIRYPDGGFDLVICSHVLEHIPDDLRAMREIRRILSRDGSAVLLVPISKLIEAVIEDPGEADETERWRRFGQGDHVRIYDKSGFIARLDQAGFRVEQYRPDPSRASIFGLSAANCLYIARP